MADGIISALKQYVSERFNTLLMNMVFFLEYNQYVVIFYTRRRKMRKVSLLLTVAICASLLGCGKTENADAGAATAVSAEAIESVTESVSVPKTDTASTSFTEALADEGTYWMSGYLRASDKDSAGEPDESGVLQAIIYEAYIEDDILTVKGVTNFRNDKAQDPVGMNDGDEAAFIITDQTIFQMVGGEDGPEDVTKEEFAQYLKDCADSGLLLDIQVTGAQVVVAQICA